MEKPRITTVDGVEHEMINLTGRSYRIAAEFDNNAPQLTDVDFVERHADIVSKFYDGVTKEDVLEMPLEEILPASMAVRAAVYNLTWSKTKEITKNSEEGKGQ